jgi:hypothetical protein
MLPWRSISGQPAFDLEQFIYERHKLLQFNRFLQGAVSAETCRHFQGVIRRKPVVILHPTPAAGNRNDFDRGVLGFQVKNRPDAIFLRHKNIGNDQIAGLVLVKP